MKNSLIVVLVVLLIGIAAYAFLWKSSNQVVINPESTPPVTGEDQPVVSGPDTTPIVEPEQASEDDTMTTLGTSVEGRDIIAYHFGVGSREVIFVGGIHGGYSWNTALVAYELIDYLESTPTAIPENVRVTVIPVLNPDGLAKVTSKTGPFTSTDVTGTDAVKVSGRFNANTVDLNRNFDCDCQAQGTWQNRTVSGGSAAFSEPESMAMRAYIEEAEPDAVVVWYSAAGGIYASNCHNGVLPETATLTSLYAQASGYPAYQSFDYYTLTGDMVNWLAKEGMPGISVLLTNHTDSEWSKNKAGIDAVLAHFAE